MNFNFAAVINAVLHLKRTCPQCQREQVVPFSQKDQTVPCKFCNAPVPPHKPEQR